jgi:Domain of unknown function (DUF4396)
MAPDWANAVGWAFLGLGFVSALVVLGDELFPGRRQHMGVMNLVHPITALYWGPVWLLAYFRRARASSHAAMHEQARWLAENGADPDELRRRAGATSEQELRPWHVGNAVSHCGAGCTLGDIGGEWIVWALGAPTIGAAGSFGPEVIADFILAWSLGIVFQYFTIVPMRSDAGRLRGLWLAVRADTLSILSFQVGLFGWMAISHFVLFRTPLAIDTSAHWGMMQVGMVLGYLTAWPANAWLIRRGWKEKMDRRRHLAGMVERLGHRQPHEPAPARA